MTYKLDKTTLFIAVTILQTVDVQFMYPMQQPMYMMPPPPPQPVPVPVPFPVAIPYRVTQKPTTTTTTKKPEESSERGIAIPIAVPMPVPYAVPAAPPPLFCGSRPGAPGCPPCPPCSCKPVCTPAFFSYCSPCHQICRCRYNGAPWPLPPVYAPPPAPVVAVVPFPPPPARFPPVKSECNRRIRKYRSSTEDSSTDSDCDYDDSESSSSSDIGWFRNGPGRERHMHKKSHKRRHDRPISFKKRRLRGRNHRKFLSEPENIDMRDSNIVKPVLAYVSENGKVVFHQKINYEDAARLMRKDTQIESKEQTNSRQLNNEKSGRRMVETKEIMGQNKKVLFKTPPNKKVSNLSVSFSLV